MKFVRLYLYWNKLHWLVESFDSQGLPIVHWEFLFVLRYDILVVLFFVLRVLMRILVVMGRGRVISNRILLFLGRLRVLQSLMSTFGLFKHRVLVCSHVNYAVDGLRSSSDSPAQVYSTVLTAIPGR